MNRRASPTRRSARLARLASCPSQAQVQRRREREETSGGPPAPHNSVDRTIVLDDVPDTSHQEEVFREAPRSPRAQARRPLPTFLDESVIVMEDTLPARRREVRRHGAGAAVLQDNLGRLLRTIATSHQNTWIW